MTLTPHCTIQLFTAGAWRDAGSVSLFAPAPQGWRAHSYTGYDVAWAVEHDGARDAHAFTCRFPVGLASMELPHWPVLLAGAANPIGHLRIREAAECCGCMRRWCCARASSRWLR
jgi:hypothetical protein